MNTIAVIGGELRRLLLTRTYLYCLLLILLVSQNFLGRLILDGSGVTNASGLFSVNLLNPPVLLFYMTVVPQFIGPQDAYLARALVLGATHVAMSVVWQGACGVAVGVAAEHMRRPAVRRALEGATGAVLVALGARLLF